MLGAYEELDFREKDRKLENFKRKIREKRELTTKPNANVVIVAPIKPSQVFFGESEINGVFPNSFPNMNANTSLATTKSAGRINQMIP
jgi:hypothetical protein